MQFEGHLELHAGGQREVIHAAVERDDPAVQQIARREHLAAEVVDDQDAVVGLHLAGRDEDAGGFVEAQFQHGGRQFAAHGDAGALADDPARVEQIVVERAAGWTTGSKRVMMWPSTSTAYGITTAS